MELIEKVMKGIKVGLERYQTKLLNDMKDRCPVDTGRMRGSIDVVSEKADGSFQIQVNVEYADYVEEGMGGTEESPKKMWAAKLARGDRGPSTIPFAAPSVYQNRDFLSRKLSEAIKNEFNKY